MCTEMQKTSLEEKSPIPFSWYFMNEEDWVDEIDEFPGDYDEDYGIESDFCDKIDEVIKLNLGNALNRLELVLKKFPIHHISVNVDLSGLKHTDAFCINSGMFQESGENNICIGIGPGMLKSFLEKYFYPNADSSFYHELNFDHELIHGMDQNLWSYNPKGVSPETPKEFLMDYLLKYQTEGLACFSTFLRGILGEKSFSKASSKFKKNWAIVTSFSQQDPQNWKTLTEKLGSHRHDPYNLGSMMVLQGIKVKACVNHNFDLIQLVEKAMNIDVLNLDEINELIIAGLELSFPEFVSGLHETDHRGISFISLENFLPALKQVNSWNNYLSDVQHKKIDQKVSIPDLEKELLSLKDIEDEMIELKKLELEYAIQQSINYKKYQLNCDKFYLKFM